MLRQTFKVSWDDGDLIEVKTNARDMASAMEYQDNPALGAYAMVYTALERAGYELPKFDEWVDVLDEFQGEAPSGDVLPTKGADSMSAPS